MDDGMVLHVRERIHHYRSEVGTYHSTGSELFFTITVYIRFNPCDIALVDDKYLVLSRFTACVVNNDKRRLSIKEHIGDSLHRTDIHLPLNQ
jgi:hypothetical protein